MMKTTNSAPKNRKKPTTGRTLADVIRNEGIKAKGYGTVPKFVTHDLDLSIESKVIYGYFCVLAGNGETAFPSRATILRDLKLSKNGYYKHYNALIKHGYITVERANRICYTLSE
jgi:hypothetical protein